MLWIIHPWMTVAVFKMSTFVIILIKIYFPIHMANAHCSAACHRFPTGGRLGMNPRWSALKVLHKAPGQMGTGCSQLLTPSQPFPALGLARVATHWNKLVPSWPWELWPKELSQRCPSGFLAFCPAGILSICALEAGLLCPLHACIARAVRELHAWNGKFVRKESGATWSCFSYKKCKFFSRYFEVMTV